MRSALLIALLSGLLVGICLAVYTHTLVAPKVLATHWSISVFSPVRELYKEFISQNKLAFYLSGTARNTTLTIYVLVSGPYIDSILRKFDRLLDYMVNTSIVLVPLDFNETYAKLSIAFSCILSTNRSTAENTSLVRKLVDKLHAGPVEDVVREFAPTCISYLNKTGFVVNSSYAILRAIEAYGLLSYAEVLPYENYASRKVPLYLHVDLIYVVCNNERKICVATLSDRLEVVYRNVLTQVPFGYE